jgi:NPCBM-associated, NEW3 domain of alpha-galactosidase
MDRRRRIHRGLGALTAAVTVAGLLGAPADATTAAGVPGATGQAGSPYPCSTSNNSQFQAASGLSVDVSAIGWLGNDQGAVACLGGSFFVQNGIDTTYGYGVYNYSPTTWTSADGYLPALVTGFADHGANVSITNFGDRVVLGGHAYVAIYSRVAVHNPTAHPVTVNPEPSPGLLPLSHAPDTVPPGQTVDHDYVVAADRFGNSYPWPTATELEQAGGWTEHFAHMRAFWTAQLATITQLNLPDPQLVDAYKAGFIYAQIDRSGNQLDTGTNGYHAEYEHDVIGILANMFNEGYYPGAHALLNEVDTVVGTNGQYADGLWTYPWLWAMYLEKTGDLAYLKQHFAKPGPLGASKQPSIQATAHQTAADRTGPGGIMEETSDIDANGYWTSDNFEALLGLASYVYLAKAVGNQAQASWGEAEYASLQKAVDATLAHTTTTYHLDYLPCSMVEPNTYNRCADPLDGNWAAPGVYTNEAWHGYLMGATVSGFAGRSMAAWLDSTLRYGFARTAGVVPPTTFGGYPGEGFYSTTYNAGYGAWGIASTRYRDESILANEFMLANDQSGPYAWWEGSAAPADTTPWIGNHPSSAGGASPHSWGISLATQGLLDSLASQMANGTLIVGRGIPNGWLAPGKSIDVSNFPVTDGHRLGLDISSTGRAVSLSLAGTPSGPVVFDLPAFVDNIAGTSTGRVNEAAGTVEIAPGTRQVTVRLRHLQLTPAATSLRIDPASAVHVGAGGSTTVTATFADSGPGAVRDLQLAVQAPDGWQVTPVGSVTAVSVAAGTTVTGRWRLTAPQGSRTSTAILTAAASYTDATTGRHERTAARELGAPGISRLSARKAAAGEIVTVEGAGFGPSQGTSSALQLTDQDTTWSAPGTLPTLRVRQWTDHLIVFQVPTPSGPDGDTYQVVPGTTAKLQVITVGGESNTVNLSIVSN